MIQRLARLLGLTDPQDSPDSYQPETGRPTPTLLDLQNTARALVTALVEDDTPLANEVMVDADEPEFVLALAATQLAWLFREACDHPCRCDAGTRWRQWIARDLANQLPER